MTSWAFAAPFRLPFAGTVGLAADFEANADAVASIFDTIGFDAQTPEQISIYCPTTREGASGTTVAVAYRVNGSGGAYTDAHPLLHVVPAEVTTGAPITIVDAYAGSIFDLTPGVTYDVRLTISEPSEADVVLTSTRATRSLPAAAGAATVTATTADNLQTKFNALSAGDVLELADGTYTVSSLALSNSGSSGSPIYIRGASKTGTIIKDTTAEVLTLAAGLSHVALENLTIEGSSSDSGTSSTSAGLIFSNAGAAQTNITIRDVNFVGVDRGIKAYDTAGVNGCLVYGCEMTGNNDWAQTYTDNGGTPNLTWNDDGISLPGQGNAAWNNTLRGFGDAFSIKDAVLSAAVYYYRNLIERTGDDAFEADYSTRNIGFYDNYIGNGATLMSADPVWGGPLYCFRNTAINLVRGPFKLTNQNSGWLVYNNTILKGTVPTIGGNEYGWYSSNNGLQQGVSFRNNVLVKRGSGTDLRLEFNALRIDFTHNAWYPNGGFNWTNAGGDFASAALAAAGLPTRTTLFGSTQRHGSDVAATTNPWAETVTLGADYTTEYTALQRLVLSGGDAAASGVEIPGITDGFSGAAPDRGAEIAGRTSVVYGVAGLTPSWTLMTAGTVAAMPGNTLADINPDNDPAINPSHGGGASPVSAPWHGLGYWPNIITAWCGLSFDPTLWEARMTNPGGHDGWWAPCSMRWELNQEAPAWSLVNVPPGALGATATSYSLANAYFNNAVGGVNYWDMPDAAGTGSSGIPRAIHTTNYAFFAPGLGHGNADEITIAPSGGSDPTHQCGYIVSDSTGLPIITSASGPNGSGGYSCAAVDTARGYVWKKGTGSFTYFDKWNLTDGASWSHGSALDFYLSGPSSMAPSPDLDIFLVGNGGAPGQSLSGGWAILDPATGLFYATALAGLSSHIAGCEAGPTFIGAEDGQYACGLHPGECQPRWSAIDQCFYAWDMTTGSTHKLMRIAHTSGDPRNGTWTIDYLTFTGSTPSARTGNGTYGRGVLIDDARVFVVLNSVSETGWRFKLS